VLAERFQTANGACLHRHCVEPDGNTKNGKYVPRTSLRVRQCTSMDLDIIHSPSQSFLPSLLQTSAKSTWLDDRNLSHGYGAAVFPSGLPEMVSDRSATYYSNPPWFQE
jgi:hypothetical protein